MLQFIMKKTLNIWIYHETKSPKVIKRSGYEGYQKEGWSSSAGKFADLNDFGVDNDKILAGDEEEKMKAQQVLDVVKGVETSLNDALNIDSMTGKEIAEYAMTNFNVKLNPKMKKSDLILKAKALSE